MFDTFKRIDDLKNERRQLQCHECHQRSIHTLEAKCSGEAEQRVDPNYSIDYGSDFLILRCGNCDAISFVVSSWNSEDIDADEFGNGFLPRYEKQYPVPTSSEFVFNTDHVPEGLKGLLEEMLYSLAGGHLRLATIALRMTIEFIVKDSKCKGRDLKDKINDLHGRELIDEDQRELLHKIRIKGNASAHEAKPMPKREMVAAMGVVELLLEAFYNGPGRKKRLISFAQGAFAEPNDDPISF